jgi:hypothetical protein
MSGLSRRFRHVHIALWLALLGVGQAGCKSWIRPGVDNPIPLNTSSPFGQGSAVLLPGADYHLVTVRTGPIARQPDGQVIPGQDVLCSEPSPDWAIAFGTAMAGAASGGASGGPSGSISGSASTTEAITAMAGRTAGVVALRDGLYSACQAYANQLIGKDAYSLILSQYGNLLVALASGGGGGAASTTSTSSAPPPGVAVAVSTGGAPGSANPSGTPPSSAPSKGGDSQVAQMQQQAVQAMLVSCISYNDSSIPHAKNQLLETYCNFFMSELGMVLPDLLKPAGATNQTPSGPKPAAARSRQTHSGPKSAAVSTVAVKDLQQVLLQEGDYQGPMDGVYGPETKAAYQKYLTKHSSGPTQIQPR